MRLSRQTIGKPKKIKPKLPKKTGVCPDVLESMEIRKRKEKKKKKRSERSGFKSKSWWRSLVKVRESR